jgi:hypothetical protein
MQQTRPLRTDRVAEAKVDMSMSDITCRASRRNNQVEHTREVSR